MGSATSPQAGIIGPNILILACPSMSLAGEWCYYRALAGYLFGGLLPASARKNIFKKSEKFSKKPLTIPIMYFTFCKT
jgi:hypothetical protein